MAPCKLEMQSQPRGFQLAEPHKGMLPALPGSESSYIHPSPCPGRARWPTMRRCNHSHDANAIIPPPLPGKQQLPCTLAHTHPRASVAGSGPSPAGMQLPLFPSTVVCFTVVLFKAVTHLAGSQLPGPAAVGAASSLHPFARMRDTRLQALMLLPGPQGCGRPLGTKHWGLVPYSQGAYGAAGVPLRW